MSAQPKDRRFARNIRWQFVANGAQAVLGGGYLLVLGRALGPADFGVFSVVAAIASVAGLMLELRIQDVVARDLCDIADGSEASHRSGHHLVDLFLLETLSRLLPVAGLFLLAPWLVQASHLADDAPRLIALAALGFFLSKSGTGLSMGLLRVLGRTDVIAGCMASDWGLRLALTAALSIVATLTVEGALWIALVVGCSLNIAQLMLAAREFSRNVGPLTLSGWTPKGALARLRGSRRLIAANLGVSASDLMAKDLDLTLIASFMTAEKVGLYKMAKSFVQVIWRAIDPFYLAIMPEVQKLSRSGDTTRLRRLLHKTSTRLLALSIGLVSVGGALAFLLGDRVLGPGYAQVPGLMTLMSVWVVFCAPLVWGHPLAVAIDRPELALAGSLLGSVVGVIAFLTLTPVWGLTGAATAWVATLLAGFFFTAGTAYALARRGWNTSTAQTPPAQRPMAPP